MTAGVAGTLLGYPVFTCDAMPVVATNSHSIIFGNWRRGTSWSTSADRCALPSTRTRHQGRFVYVRRRVGGRILNNDALKVLKRQRHNPVGFCRAGGFRQRGAAHEAAAPEPRLIL
jgi:HK97 family phage major capsid protein